MILSPLIVYSRSILIRRGTMFLASKPVLPLQHKDLRQETPPSTCRAGVEEKSNSRLIGIDHGQVTFRYRRCKERRWRTMTLAAEEFMRRFLQHVLPRGTHKVRYYGIWHPSKRQLLRQVQLLTGASQLPVATHDEGTSQTDTPGDGSVDKPRTCPHCRQGLLVLRQTIPRKPRPPP